MMPPGFPKTTSGRGWLLLLSYLFAGILLYYGALDNGFHYDDRYVLLENEGITHGDRILSVFTGMDPAGSDALHRKHYRPLVYASYALNYAIGGWNPAGYHALNLLFHILSAFLAAMVLTTLTGRFGVGALGGLIFLFHPVNAEAINYITARSTQMYALFYLLAFYAYLRFHPPAVPLSGKPSPPKEGGGRLWLVLSFAAFVLSILSKEMAVTLPLTLVLYETWLRSDGGSLKRRFAALWIPALMLPAVIVPYLAIRHALVGNLVSSTVQRDGVSQFATQSVVLWKTVGLYLLPTGLTIDHPVEIYPSLASWPPALALAAWGLCIGVCFPWVRSGEIGKRLPVFLISWLPVSLIPVILIPLNATLQENRSYLAGIGLIGLLSFWGVRWSDRLRERSPFGFRGIQGGVILILALYAFLVQQRNVVWQDDLSLWRDAVRKNPSSIEGHLGLGTLYQNRKEMDKAMGEYREVLRFQPLDYRARGNLAQIYRQKGQYDESAAEFRRILRIFPEDPAAHYQLGVTYQAMGRLDEAAGEYRAALSADPGYKRARVRLEQLAVLGKKRGPANQGRAVP